MGIVLICLGLAVALAGSFVLGSAPLIEVGQLAAGWGGGNEDEWAALISRTRKTMIIGNSLLAIGTTLQILGSVPKVVDIASNLLQK